MGRSPAVGVSSRSDGRQRGVVRGAAKRSTAGFVRCRRFGPTGRNWTGALASGERSGRAGGARVSAAVGSRARRRSVGQPVRARGRRGRGRARAAAHRSLRGSAPATPDGFRRRRHGRDGASARARRRFGSARRDGRVARDDRGSALGAHAGRAASASSGTSRGSGGRPRIISRSSFARSARSDSCSDRSGRCVWSKRRPPTSTCWPTTSPVRRSPMRATSARRHERLACNLLPFLDFPASRAPCELVHKTPQPRPVSKLTPSR